MRLGRITTAAAMCAAAVLASATPALAVSTYGQCDEGVGHFRFAINWVPTSGNNILVNSYAYKIYGQIGTNNKVTIKVRDADGDTIPGSSRTIQPAHETRPDRWVTYDLADIRLPASGTYFGWGEGVFDVPGLNYGCSDQTAAFG